MYITWEPAKAKSNLKKHHVDFADAAVALEDENALTILDEDHSEIRFRTLALAPETNVLLIVHAEQDEETIRIISAREATPKEKQQYYQGDLNDR